MSLSTPSLIQGTLLPRIESEYIFDIEFRDAVIPALKLYELESFADSTGIGAALIRELKTDLCEWVGTYSNTNTSSIT